MNDKKTEKRLKIIETGYRLFQQKSVDSTAIDDVVKAAGIARGTFYLYFKDKSDLLEQIILFKSTEAMKELLLTARDRLSNENYTAAQMADEFIDMYIDFLVDHKDVLAVVTKNIASCMRLFPSFYDKDIDNIYLSIIKKFEENGCPADKANRTAYIIAELIASVCSDALLTEKPFSIDEIRQDVKTAALNIIKGVLSPVPPAVKELNE